MATLRTVRRLAVLILLAATLAGCRTKEPPPDATATTATTLLPTTTIPPPTTTIDVKSAPTASQLQDPAYWNAVLATLNSVVGDAVRSAVRAGKVEPAALEAFRQVYGPGTFDDRHQVLARVAAGERNGLVVPPGDAAARVIDVVKVAVECVALTASLDYGAVNSTVPTSTNVMELMPRPRRSSGDMNPTPWVINEFFIIEQQEDVSRVCVG